MRKTILILTFVLLVSAAGFAQTSNSSNEKNILWSRDKPYCDSVLVDGAEYRIIHINNLKIAFTLDSFEGYQIARLYVLNEGEKRINVLPSDSYIATWKKQDEYLQGKNAVIYQSIPAETIVKKMENRARWANALGAFGASMQTKTTTVTDNQGNTATITSPNTQAQSDANNRSKDNNARVQTTGSALIDSSFKANTIYKNDNIFGNIYFKWKKHEIGIFSIKIEGVEYGFLYSFVKDKQENAQTKGNEKTQDKTNKNTENTDTQSRPNNENLSFLAGTYTGEWKSEVAGFNGTLVIVFTPENGEMKAKAVFTGSDYFNEDALDLRFTPIGGGIWKMEYRGKQSGIQGTAIISGDKITADYKFQIDGSVDTGKWVLNKNK